MLVIIGTNVLLPDCWMRGGGNLCSRYLPELSIKQCPWTVLRNVINREKAP